MIYRALERWVDARRGLRALRVALERESARPRPEHDAAVRVLVELGELESAFADLLMPAEDGLSPDLGALRTLALEAGRLLSRAWRGRGALDRRAAPIAPEIWAGPVDLTDAWARALALVDHLDGPLRVSIPEGFAVYGLYPETYIEAAEAFARSHAPAPAVCLGLRSIGGPLSAVVAAAFEAEGWRVSTWTLRPRGHPFARTVALAPDLEQALRAQAEGWAFVVDEGPGLSGSSLTGAAARLVDLGFSEDRVVLFPSWCPDGQRFVSLDAQARWPRHPKALADFDATWVTSGRLADRPLRPIDGGRWRALVFPRDDLAYPPVQPEHERRKYLTVEGEAHVGVPCMGAIPHLLKFAGLAGYGEAALERARILADAGFTPRVEDLRHGFLVQPFVAGRALAPKDVGPAFLGHAARYLAFLARTFPAARRTPAAELGAMITESVEALLGPRGSSPALERWLGGVERDLGAGAAVALDGRVMPWEWLVTPEGFVKTDALDHHADHFFPGSASITWDLAGLALELGLDGPGEAHLLDAFVRAGGDPGVRALLPTYRVAYAAFTASYARLAEESTGGTPEAPRFRRRAEGATGWLSRALQAVGAETVVPVRSEVAP